MEWLYVMIAALGIWSLTSLVDKSVFNHYVTDKVFYTLFPAVVHFPLVALLLFLPFTPPLVDASLFPILVAVGAGAFEFLLLVILFIAMGRDEISTVFPLTAISPVFILLMGWLFFGETLSYIESVAFLFFIAGAFFMATKIRWGIGVSFSKALGPALLLAFLGSLSTIFFKIGINALDAWTTLFYSRIGLLLAGAGLFSLPSMRDRIRVGWALVPKNIRYVVLGNQVLAVFGHLLYFVALGLGTTALVSASFGMQHVMIFVFATVVSFFWPRLLGEDTTPTNLLRKMIGISLVVVGIVLVSGLFG